jgi:hypothetical protein
VGVGEATGSKKSGVPWLALHDNGSDFYDAEYLPEGYGLKDPSKLGQFDTKVLLQYWRQRQEDGLKLFAFQAFLNSDKEIE